MSDNWYASNIEEGVRDIVHLLRDNGINTVDSCHHEMTIQAEYHIDGTIHYIHNLLWTYMSERREPIDFEIIARHKIENGYFVKTRIEIILGRPKVKPLGQKEEQKWTLPE